jgi:DUF2075 family protein
MSTNKQRIDIMDVSVEDYYSDLDEWLRRFSHMNLARWKILQNTAISILVFLLAWQAGADPTAALAVIALINGLSFGDLAAIWGISVEVRGDGPAVVLDRDKTQDDNGESESTLTERERR